MQLTFTLIVFPTPQPPVSLADLLNLRCSSEELRTLSPNSHSLAPPALRLNQITAAENIQRNWLRAAMSKSCPERHSEVVSAGKAYSDSSSGLSGYAGASTRADTTSRKALFPSPSRPKPSLSASQCNPDTADPFADASRSASPSPSRASSPAPSHAVSKSPCSTSTHDHHRATCMCVCWKQHLKQAASQLQDVRPGVVLSPQGTVLVLPKKLGGKGPGTGRRACGCPARMCKCGAFPPKPPHLKKPKGKGPGTGRRACGCPSRRCVCGAAAQRTPPYIHVPGVGLVQSKQAEAIVQAQIEGKIVLPGFNHSCCCGASGAHGCVSAPMTNSPMHVKRAGNRGVGVDGERHASGSRSERSGLMGDSYSGDEEGSEKEEEEEEEEGEDARRDDGEEEEEDEDEEERHGKAVRRGGWSGYMREGRDESEEAEAQRMNQPSPKASARLGDCHDVIHRNNSSSCSSLGSPRRSQGVPVSRAVVPSGWGVQKRRSSKVRRSSSGRRSGWVDSRVEGAVVVTRGGERGRRARPHSVLAVARIEAAVMR